VRDQEEAAERLTASLRDLVSDLRTDEVLRKIMENAQGVLLGREIAVLTTSGKPVYAPTGRRVCPSRRFAGSRPG